jgi:hypothetical protein
MQSDYQLNFKEFENGQNICKSSGIFLFSSMDFDFEWGLKWFLKNKYRRLLPTVR